MHLYDVVLFLHIATLLAAIGLATTLHHAEWSTREATTVGELRTMTGVYRRGRLFPIVILLLLAEGAWLLHLSKKQDETFRFGDAWVWTAVAALVILAVSGGAVLDRHASRYAKLLAATPDGPIPSEVRAATFATSTWAVSHMNTFLAIAVAFNMVTKPTDDVTAVVVIAVGIVVGSLVGVAGARGRSALAA
ncbi:MAG: hypothetical protein JWO12_656 [Frankiales bacterium]|jgi:hypothetical protein|nr:hypothetical protein [Frankiales bacterium]